jgi:hypothetical protein
MFAIAGEVTLFYTVTANFTKDAHWLLTKK